jgi:hypothetical protein
VNIRHRARTLALASLLALAMLVLPALQGQALATNNCDPKDCGTRTCTYAGKTYTGGETRVGPPVLGTKRIQYMCDGFTGTWTVIGRSQPTSSDHGPLPVNQQHP